MAEIHRLGAIVSDAITLDPDMLLQAVQGQGLIDLVIVATQPDGRLWVSSSCGAGDAVMQMERAKRLIIFGEGGE